MGFKKFGQNGIDNFFEVIRIRYENGSMMIANNRVFEDWGEIFDDKVMASAIIDRIIHNAFIVKIKNERYRVRDVISRRERFKLHQSN